MANNLAERLEWLGFTAGVDFRAQDNSDGNGPFIAEWRSEKPQPTEAEIAAATPPASLYTLERYQFVAMLELAGLTATVDAAIAAIPDHAARIVARSRYDNEQVFHRDDPLLVQLAGAAGLTPAQVDAYWMQAKDL